MRAIDFAHADANGIVSGDASGVVNGDASGVANGVVNEDTSGDASVANGPFNRVQR